MKCKEYDKITKDFKNAISMMHILEQSDERITNVLCNINPTEEKKKLWKEFRSFRENNERGKKC